jgi:hypothetical protein
MRPAGYSAPKSAPNPPDKSSYPSFVRVCGLKSLRPKKGLKYTELLIKKSDQLSRIGAFDALLASLQCMSLTAMDAVGTVAMPIPSSLSHFLYGLLTT